MDKLKLYCYQGRRKGALKLKRLGESVECTSDLTGVHILLVDDILTTGLMAATCQKALKGAGV